MRAQPSREDLRLFVENAASLDGPRVAKLLEEQLVRSFAYFNISCFLL